MHVAFVPLTGLRVISPEIRALGVRWPDLRRRGAAVAGLPALGLLTLAGMLPADVACSWHPAAEVDDALIQALVSRRPDLVAVSATTATAEEAYDLGDRLRAEGLPTVFGGLHATACPREAQQHFDAVVVGDGEPVWPKVFADARDGTLDQQYHRRWAPDEGSWPLPRFDLHGTNQGRWTLQTQRGCPFSCEFCAASRMLGPHRVKPVSDIQRELDALLHLDERPLVEFADDNTFAARKDPLKLLDCLERSGALWFTEVDWRLGQRPEILERLASSGCVQVLVGLESPIHDYPGMGSKQAQLDDMMRAIDAIHEAGVVVHGCFIAGADGETRASLESIGDFVLDSCLADVQITLQTPFPGTALRRRLQREGRLLQDRGWAHHTLFDVTYEPDAMSVPELEAGFHELLGRVHDPAAVRRRSELRRTIWRTHPRMRSSSQARIDT